MHDPMVVAWEIHLPLPRRYSIPPSPRDPRTGVVRRRRTNPGNLGEPVYPWWRPCGYRLYVAGRRYVMWRLATIWHVEPHGADSGSICRHYVRWHDPDRGWQAKSKRAWRWHVHHWQVTLPGLRLLRRRLLTRCTWCGGRSTRTDPVDNSIVWDSPRTPWWRGETHLYHGGCMSVYHAHSVCLCENPALSNGDYGRCSACGKGRAWRSADDITPEHDQATRILAALPAGSRLTPQVRAQVEPLWKANQERARARRREAAK